MTDIANQTLTTRRHGAKSTATELQRDSIINMLKSVTKTTMDFRRNGIMEPAARIREMRLRGYQITTERLITLYDEQCFAHKRLAAYRLDALPDGALS